MTAQKFIEEKLEKYFQSLEWDGEDHILKLIETIEFEGKPTPESIIDWLERASNFNCHWQKDNWLVLVGSPACGKTTFINKIMSPKIINQHSHTGCLDLKLSSQKKLKTLFSQNFIINIDDQPQHIKPNDMLTIKSLISSVNYRIWKPSEKDYSIYANIANLISATNKLNVYDHKLIRHVVNVKKIDIEKLQEIDMNQVWAQIEYQKLPF